MHGCPIPLPGPTVALEAKRRRASHCVRSEKQAVCSKTDKDEPTVAQTVMFLKAVFNWHDFYVV